MLRSLDHFQLNQVKRAAVITESHPVCRNLETILEESQKPAKQDNADQRQMLEPTELLFHLQMPVPGTRHKDIGHNQ